MDKQYIEEITIANAAMNYPGIDVSAVRDYMKGGTPKIVTVRCLCTDCVYNKKARCAKPGGMRTGYIFSAWVHPDNGCILAGMEVTDDMLLSWNKRGGVECNT